ncbi:DUF4230 domain-containing protein [Saccharopolyspora sp. K220]|uniref:DUF4230 domain-containing protein n=1 Tax=Saccharopolyspora soli TaxID=2926618 RepID=UPI001F5859AC|nr:DUF4230 domain-containing protein [Saccharopolyspora soli]MCI2419281.1 DUF4230 domain-containing protein [Saccharopolyspora soli]
MKVRWLQAGLLGAALLLVVATVLQLVGLLPELNPFGRETIDRSQPAVLRSMRDLSQYHAAVGDYQVVIDVEKDVKGVPSALAGERTLFVAAGTVNAYVDFGRLADDGLNVSPDGTSVQVKLPTPVLDKPNIDNRRSYVFSQQRGLIDRLNAIVETPTQQEFYVAAEQRIADAAKESGLVDRARDNTKVMLTGMLQALGFRQVTFVDDEP